MAATKRPTLKLRRSPGTDARSRRNLTRFGYYTHHRRTSLPPMSLLCSSHHNAPPGIWYYHPYLQTWTTALLVYCYYTIIIMIIIIFSKCRSVYNQSINKIFNLHSQLAGNWLRYCTKSEIKTNKLKQKKVLLDSVKSGRFVTITVHCNLINAFMFYFMCTSYAILSFNPFVLVFVSYAICYTNVADQRWWVRRFSVTCRR